MLTSLTLALCMAAPAPQPKAHQPLVPGSGVWELTWVGTRTSWELLPNGTCQCPWCGDMYRGTWYWHPNTRTLYVNETKDGKSWARWCVVLEPITDVRTGREVALTGITLYGSTSTTIKLSKSKRLIMPEQIKVMPKGEGQPLTPIQRQRATATTNGASSTTVAMGTVR